MPSPEKCPHCGREAYYDINGDIWAHECRDGRLRWADDGSLCYPKMSADEEKEWRRKRRTG